VDVPYSFVNYVDVIAFLVKKSGAIALVLPSVMAGQQAGR